MIKVSFFASDSEHGPPAVPLLNRQTDGYLEKTAGQLLPEVSRYIEALRPREDACYVLVNAMGAGEYYGSNSNADWFPEAALIHAPDDWAHNPHLDKPRSKDWPYGYPTFYYAHPFAHHRNSDATRAFGEVELAAWNDAMKRVELVTRVDKDKCERFGGVAVWDKLKAGQYIDCSMGCRVPFDTASCCLDWKKYRKAQATFDPKRHKHPGIAVLEFHKKDPIRGLAVTSKGYCEHMLHERNKIRPDGTKIFVYNDYPCFFDISFVFVGADKTAKVMLKIASRDRGFWDVASSCEIADRLGYGEEKVASTKQARIKGGEIVKDVVPAPSAPGAARILSKSDRDLPKDVLNALGGFPLEASLSTSGALGIVLRPAEFQRIFLVSTGSRGLADSYDSMGVCFPESLERGPLSLGPERFLSVIARLLLPFFSGRSALAPAAERRVVLAVSGPEPSRKYASLCSPLLRRIGSAYATYRGELLDLAAHAQDFLGSPAWYPGGELRKVATSRPEDVFTPLTVAYLERAFLGEGASRSRPV